MERCSCVLQLCSHTQKNSYYYYRSVNVVTKSDCENNTKLVCVVVFTQFEKSCYVTFNICFIYIIYTVYISHCFHRFSVVSGSVYAFVYSQLLIHVVWQSSDQSTSEQLHAVLMVFLIIYLFNAQRDGSFWWCNAAGWDFLYSSLLLKWLFGEPKGICCEGSVFSRCYVSLSWPESTKAANELFLPGSWAHLSPKALRRVAWISVSSTY